LQHRIRLRNYILERIAGAIRSAKKDPLPFLGTEGNEYDILNAFDFDRCRIKIILRDYNHSLNLDKILSLLEDIGYERYVPHLSEFDEWFVLRTSRILGSGPPGFLEKPQRLEAGR